MNKRRVIIGAGLVALAGSITLTAPRFFTRSRHDGRVTLRSRVLDYEDAFDNMEQFPSKEYIDIIITRLMEEYFKIGMSYDECVKILEENDLKIDEIAKNDIVIRYLPNLVYYSPSVVSVVKLPSWFPLVNCQYRLILRFHNSILDEIVASRTCTGP